MNNYYDLAESDLEEAQDRYNAGKYNKCALWCQQASEKYLKYILFDRIFTDKVDESDSRLLHEHRLKLLYDRINRDGKVLDIPISYLFSISNYYIKTRYPGEGFVEVEAELAKDLLQYANSIKSVVDDYLGYN